MTLGPRIVFMRVPIVDTSRFSTWREHTARVVGTAPDFAPVDDREGVVVWSLVTGNNREIARSSQIYSRFDDAVESAERTVAGHAELEIRLVSDRRRGGYGWFLDRDDRAEVVCARWYESDRDRRQAAAVARQALTASVLQQGTRQMLD